MRQTGPVTQQEYFFPPGATLVSVTDDKGRITYCNQAFIEVSGYTREELLGQPHNLVRHPDMPAEAFRDLWATIAAGRPWSGLVKNRRKNGDHYWVMANATPVRSGNRTVGYMSVRTQPSREQVQEAEALYSEMRHGSRLGLDAGQAVRRDPLGRLLNLGQAWLRCQGLSTLAGLLGSLGVGTLVSAGAPLQTWLPAAAVAALGLAWVIRRSQRACIQQVTQQALSLAAGDLCAPPGQMVDGDWKDLQGALNQLGVNIRTVVLDCRTEIERLREAVAEIATGNQDLSSRTESQASSLQQTAATMEQITGNVAQSASSALQGAKLAQDTASVAARTDACVQDVGRAMSQIQHSSRRIGEVIHVIEGVAFQTNILALNAAVEAARAGDSGRGFAVVASEVRSLAHRSAEAAKEVRRLIGEATERVDEGSQQTETAQQRMREALDAVGQVSQALQAISESSQEQRSGITQINSAVSHLDGLTQQNAAMVEQLAASAQSAREQLEAVENSMRLFRLREHEHSLAELDAVALRRSMKDEALVAA